MSPRASLASELTARVAAVAVDAVADRPERTFSYLLPEALGDPAPGSLVLVPYGKRLALGYLIEVGTPGTEERELKAVEAVVSEPMLTRDLIALAHEVAAYYRAPIGTTLAAMLPPGLESRLHRRWRVIDAARLPAGVAETGALDADGRLDDAELMRFAPVRGGAAWLDRLRRSGAIAASWELRPPAVHARRVRTIQRLPGDHPIPRRAPLQRSILAALDNGAVDLADLAEAVGVPAGSLLAPARRLAATGHAVLDWRAVTRDPLEHRVSAQGLRDDLSAEQQSSSSPRVASSCSRASPPQARPTSTWPPSPRSSKPEAPLSCWCRRSR